MRTDEGTVPTLLSSKNGEWPVRDRTACPFAPRASIVFAPDWDDQGDYNTNLVLLSGAFDEFIQREEAENLDMLVVEVINSARVKSLVQFVGLFRTILEGLAAHQDGQGANLFAEIESSDWDFRFQDKDFFVSTFAPLYPESHSRFSHSPSTAFIVFQPDSSFDRHHIHSAAEAREKITDFVERTFEDHGISYDCDLTTRHVKAERYVKRLSPSHAPVKWWALSR